MPRVADHSPAALRRRIHAAVRHPDAITSNRRITEAHRVLGEALATITGAEAGPNFHAWARWGSLKAGETIGRRSLPRALRDLSMAAAVVAGSISLFVGILAAGWPQGIAAAGAVIGITVVAVRRLIRRAMARSAAAILEGNRTVLDDIGRKTIAFLACFAADGSPDRRRLRRFFRGFRRGPTTLGGQDLLRQAFRCYLRASWSRDRKTRCEATYFGNCLAVLHEHYRLQPYIEASMPWLVRRYATRFLMTFRVSRQTFAVHEDLPGVAGRAFPPTLQEIADPDLAQFLAAWDRSAGELAGTGVSDWASLAQRMSFIVNLFRMMHGCASVRG